CTASRVRTRLSWGPRCSSAPSCSKASTSRSIVSAGNCCPILGPGINRYFGSESHASHGARAPEEHTTCVRSTTSFQVSPCTTAPGARDSPPHQVMCPVPGPLSGFVKLLRLRCSSGKRVLLPGPIRPLGGPLRTCHFGPTRESLPHLLRFCQVVDHPSQPVT